MDRRMCHNCTGNMYPDGDGWKCSACGVRVNAEGRYYFPKPNMTNADKIRAMSDEWLANYLMQFTDLDCRIGFCQNLPKCGALLETEDGIPLSMCEKCLLGWLQQPAEGSE